MKNISYCDGLQNSKINWLINFHNTWKWIELLCNIRNDKKNYTWLAYFGNKVKPV